MGALDILKAIRGKVLDTANYDILRATYEHQEELKTQQADMIAFMKPRVEELKEKLATAEARLAAAEGELAKLKAEEVYDTLEGISFKHLPAGGYDETPRCPACKAPLSLKHPYMVIDCVPCKYHREGVNHRAVLQKLLEAEQQP